MEKLLLPTVVNNVDVGRLGGSVAAEETVGREIGNLKRWSAK